MRMADCLVRGRLLGITPRALRSDAVLEVAVMQLLARITGSGGLMARSLQGTFLQGTFL
jgi:hypothetical protein